MTVHHMLRVLQCSNVVNDARSENTPDWMDLMAFSDMKLGECVCLVAYFEIALLSA